MNVTVKNSSVQGFGVYANKNFKTGDTVLIINDTYIVTDESKLTPHQHEYDCDYLSNGKVILMQEPEKFINHSCDPNTYVKTINGLRHVLAMKDIKRGEEITYDYAINGDNDGKFKCNCGSKNCRQVYQGNFFKLPKDLQLKYLPYLDNWFIKQHQQEINSLKTSFTMKIYLIRHGQTTGDIEDRYGGAYDDELSDEGIIQAKNLVHKLGNSGIEILFCSPLIRAQQTAKILESKLNCELKTVKDLRERNKNGILTGMTRKEAEIKYPKLVEELKDYRSQIPGAESQEDFAKRIKKAFIEITSNTDYSTIGIITHGMPFWVVFSDILNDNGIISIGDCAYAVLDKTGDKLTLEKLDGVEYKNLVSKT